MPRYPATVVLLVVYTVTLATVAYVATHALASVSAVVSAYVSH